MGASMPHLMLIVALVFLNGGTGDSLRHAASSCARGLTHLPRVSPRTARSQPRRQLQVLPIDPRIAPAEKVGSGPGKAVSKPCADGETKSCIDLKKCIVYMENHHYDFSKLNAK